MFSLIQGPWGCRRLASSWGHWIVSERLCGKEYFCLKIEISVEQDRKEANLLSPSYHRYKIQKGKKKP